MSRLGNFDGVDNTIAKPEKKADIPQATEKDKGKLVEKPDGVKKMTDKKKIDHYHSKGLDALADNREAIRRNHEGKGLSYRPAKLNSHNYDRLMSNRVAEGKIEPDEVKYTKESFSKWNPDLKDKPKDESDQVAVRHARPGEKVNVMHTSGRPASGRFVTKDNLEKLTPEQRIDTFALDKNKADSYDPAYLHKKDVIEGKVAPQKKFEGEDGIPRTGGGKQLVTNGGFEKDAVAHRKDMYTPSERQILNDMHKKGEI